MTTSDQHQQLVDLAPPPDASSVRARWYREYDGTTWSRPFMGTVRGRVQIHGVQHGDGSVERGVLIDERDGEVWLDSAAEARDLARALDAAVDEIQRLSGPDGTVA